MKRIVLFTDSLAMPRKGPQVTFYEDTYPCLLRKDYEVFQFSKGGGLMNEFIEQTFYYNQYKPDIIILQIGIVDCAPRAFSKLEETFFQSNRLLGWVRGLISKFGLSKKIRNFRRLSWTPKRCYQQGCRFFVSKFPQSQVYALSIVPPSEEYEKQVPGISKKIEEYNRILKDVFKQNLIDLSNIPAEGIMSDHHHLTKLGHQYVYDSIMCILAKG